MRRFLAVFSTIVLVATIATPSQAAGAKYSVYQKTLATFSSTATLLTAQQRDQVRAAVEANPTAEKFICTGIRYFDQPMSVNITVRKRAKAACDYAKELNPALSTWYQNKPTQARSFAGKVLLTVKTPVSPVSQDQPTQQFVNDLSLCRLNETENFTGAGAKGFPARTRGTATNKGQVKIVVAPFDYIGNEGTQAELDKYMTNLERDIEAWGEYWSRGTMTYDVVIPDTGWIRVTSPLESNLQALISASDPYVNFAATQFFFPVFPKTTDFTQVNGGSFFYGDYRVSSSEGSLTPFVFTYDGARDSGTNWSWMVHEALHPQGFIGHGPANGEQLGIMMADGQIRNSAITSWGAFLNGWWDESEILCLDGTKISDAVEVPLNILDNIGDGYESLMIRVSEEELVVVERRGPGPFSSLSEIITAYRVNVNDAHFRCDMCSDRDADKNFWYYLKEAGNIAISSTITYEGLRITNLKNGSVRIDQD